MRPAVLLLVLLTASALAGCARQDQPASPTPTSSTPAPEIVDGLLHSVVAGSVNSDVQIDAWAGSGAISRFVVNGPHVLRLPPNVFLLRDGAFVADREVGAEAGQEFQLLIPPGMTNLTLTEKAMGNEFVVPTPDTGVHFLQGENVVEWFKVQRDEYPERCAGCPNYARAQDYFAGLMRGFGLGLVEVDPYGSNPVHPAFANVVGYKYAKTDLDHPRWLGVGGHYDIIAGIPEGAFDNTAGTLAALELARALGPVRTNHNIVFGLWGGEESGLQGSAFFTKTNPNVAAQMQVYVNLDVSGFSWPAPKPVGPEGSVPDCSARPDHDPEGPTFCPDPVLVAAGPDGPVSDALLERARAIQASTMVGYPSEYFIYETVGGGQLQGYAGVNAQSDHTSFLAAGVPSYFLFNGDALNNPISIHNDRDRFDNWLKYVLRNFPGDLEEPLDPEEVEAAEQLMARSFETYLWLTFYTLLQYELELVQPV